ncbi:MAG: hypothetical protein OXC91_12605 [Rhodobacteraceae bacterium]|nr:hypothetical protein [Paracoccaceae bacterium]
MTSAEDFAPSENLGRSVFSSRQAKRAIRGIVPFHVFLEKEGEPLISVDRLDKSKSQEALQIAQSIATSRDRTFYGWAAVTADVAASNGRRVTPSPQPGNPFHADIVLPAPAIEDRDEQKQHAQELATEAQWRGLDEVRQPDIR